MYANEATKLNVGKLNDFETPTFVKVTSSSVSCGNKVDWITPPAIGTETDLSIVVRVPQDVQDDFCFVRIEATD